MNKQYKIKVKQKILKYFRVTRDIFICKLKIASLNWHLKRIFRWMFIIEKLLYNDTLYLLILITLLFLIDLIVNSELFIFIHKFLNNNYTTNIYQIFSCKTEYSGEKVYI